MNKEIVCTEADVAGLCTHYESMTVDQKVEWLNHGIENPPDMSPLMSLVLLSPVIVIGLAGAVIIVGVFFRALRS